MLRTAPHLYLGSGGTTGASPLQLLHLGSGGTTGPPCCGCSIWGQEGPQGLPAAAAVMGPPRTLPMSQLFIPTSPGWPPYSEAPRRLNGETWSAEGACGWDERVPGAGLPMDHMFSDCPPLPPPTLRPCLITDGYLHSSGGRGAFPEGSTSYQSLPTRSCMALLSPPGLRPQGRTTLHEGPCLPNSSPSPSSPRPLPLKYTGLLRSSDRMGFALHGAESALGNHDGSLQS